MKKIILLLCLLPVLASAQRFELALQGGISGNLVPSNLLARHPTAIDLPRFRTGGLNPVLQVAGFCFVQPRLKLGACVALFQHLCRNIGSGRLFRQVSCRQAFQRHLPVPVRM